MNYLLVIRLSPMHAFFEVTDGDGQPAYRSSTRLMSLTDKAVITDGADQVCLLYTSRAGCQDVGPPLPECVEKLRVPARSPLVLGHHRGVDHLGAGR